ncbi:MAG: M15 family metallopeptidase [Erysipelotrichaceae bacterium]
MKKIYTLLLCGLLSGCTFAPAKLTSEHYNEAQIAQLQEYGIFDQAEQACTYPDSLALMLEQDFDLLHWEAYCQLQLRSSQNVNALLEKGLQPESVQAYLDIPAFRMDHWDRYQNATQETLEERILYVNMNLDLEPYSTDYVVSDERYDFLVNKYYRLPEGYKPHDLVEINPEYACVRGVDYSCTLMSKQELRQEAATAYEAFAAAATAQGIAMRAIATYRTYEYQASLWNNALHNYGQAYADSYYARPGQSEHNSGLAVDITFNQINYTTIAQSPLYPWILEHAPKYGFILRYPEEQTDITLYNYESWHFRYVGVDAATTIMENGYTLEEYTARKGDAHHD